MNRSRRCSLRWCKYELARNAIECFLLQCRNHRRSSTPADPTLDWGSRTCCKELDEEVEAFRGRPLEGGFPYVWLDALRLKVRHIIPMSLREDHRPVNQALVIAIGVRETSGPDILGYSLGTSKEFAYLGLPIQRRLVGFPVACGEDRLNKEVKPRTSVVGIFPDGASVIRLVGAVLMGTPDERPVERRYLPAGASAGSQESMKKLLGPDTLLVAQPEPLRLAPVHRALWLI